MEETIIGYNYYLSNLHQQPSTTFFSQKANKITEKPILGFGFGSVKNVINAGNENNLIDTRQ